MRGFKRLLQAGLVVLYVSNFGICNDTLNDYLIKITNLNNEYNIQSYKVAELNKKFEQIYSYFNLTDIEKNEYKALVYNYNKIDLEKYDWLSRAYMGGMSKELTDFFQNNVFYRQLESCSYLMGRLESSDGINHIRNHYIENGLGANFGIFVLNRDACSNAKADMEKYLMNTFFTLFETLYKEGILKLLIENRIKLLNTTNLALNKIENYLNQLEAKYAR